MSLPRCSILRNSNSAVLSPTTVRPIPIIVPPAGWVQCSSTWARPPDALCQSPASQMRSEIFVAGPDGGVFLEAPALQTTNNVTAKINVTTVQKRVLDFILHLSLFTKQSNQDLKPTV